MGHAQGGGHRRLRQPRLPRVGRELLALPTPNPNPVPQPYNPITLTLTPTPTLTPTLYPYTLPPNQVSFSPFNAQFATASYDGGVRVFSTERRSPLPPYPLPLTPIPNPNPTPTPTPTLTPNPNLNPHPIPNPHPNPWCRSPLRLLAGHQADVNAVRFHHNGAYLLSYLLST